MYFWQWNSLASISESLIRFFYIDTLIELLEAFDEDGIEKSDLINVLRRLSDISAFTNMQVDHVNFVSIVYCFLNKSL